MTNYHVLNINDIDINKEIQLSINNDKSTIKIKIDNNRKTYTNKEYDITIIEIKKSDGLNIIILNKKRNNKI